MDDDRIFGYQEDWAHLRYFDTVVIGQLPSREVCLPLSPVSAFVSEYRDEVFPDE